MKKNLPSRKDLLVSGYLAGDLSEAECEELNNLITTEPDLGYRIMDELKMDSMLRSSVGDCLQEQASAEAVNAPPPIRFAFRISTLAAAALILITIIAALNLPGRLTAPAVEGVWVSRATGPVMVQTPQLSWRGLLAGEPIPLGKVVRLSSAGGASFNLGSAEMTFPGSGSFRIDKAAGSDTVNLSLLGGQASVQP